MNRLSLTRLINDTMDNVETQSSARQLSLALTLIAFLNPDEHRDAKKRNQTYKYLFEEGKHIVQESSHFVVTEDEERFKVLETAIDEEKRLKKEGPGGTH